MRLDRAKLEFAVDTLQLLTDVNDSGVEVDVFPAEAEHLAAAQAVEDQQHERAVQCVGPGCFYETRGLLCRPGTDDGPVPFRQPDVPGNVVGDQFLADCPGQGGTQHRSHDLHLRTEPPASSRWLRTIWTAETDSRARLLAPRPCRL
jgi:hypothetical protein